ncbi:hypothetical protein TPA0910_26770 [Streptomyces hygroscopicus subsp. sporocinereus]|uniref:Uncharacterized protein n=1 Tax=Streptomyces hygroscopicus TaxID=1912 RepID=A0ABQ3TXY1_STRHY|nr:hypothetical protein TPA0910_26770 [Streptomyces hygroscopicus]
MAMEPLGSVLTDATMPRTVGEGDTGTVGSVRKMPYPVAGAGASPSSGRRAPGSRLGRVPMGPRGPADVGGALDRYAAGEPGRRDDRHPARPLRAHLTASGRTTCLRD